MSVALIAIMQNEAAYVDRWADAIDRARRVDMRFDQIFVMDGGSTDNTIERLRARGVVVFSRTFDRDFASQRNAALAECATDWIFELDADEIPSTPLLAGIRDLIRDAERAEMDCIGIARFNFLDGVLAPSPGHKGLDYQYRLHHQRCRWEGVVHEELTGWRNRYELKIDDGHFLIHDKSAKRHEERNGMYRSIGT